MWSRCTTTTLFGVSFGRNRRPCRDLLMARHRYVPMRRLVAYDWDVFGCFQLGVSFEACLRRCGDVLMGHCHFVPWRRCHVRCHDAVSWRRTTETVWRRSTETSLGVSFETYLRRSWDVQREVVMTSPWRLVAWWLELSISITNVFLYTWILKRI